MAIEDSNANEQQGLDILLTDVPRDVVDELERRASANFRARKGEATAILTAVCRRNIKLPGVDMVKPAGSSADATESEAANG